MPTSRAATAALLLVLAAAGCKGPGDADHAVRQSDLRFLPRDTAGVAVLEVARFQDRDAVVRWLDDFLKESGGENGAAAIGRALGKPLLEKIDRAALAIIPRQGTTGYAFLAEGPFDEKTIHGLTGDSGLVTLFEAAGAADVSLLAMPGQHLALGPRAVLEDLRARAAHPGGGLLDGPLLPVLKRVDPLRQVWGGVDVTAIAALQQAAPQVTGQAPLASLARNLNALAFQAAFDKTVDFEVVGLASGDAGAKTLADAARGLVAIARVSASQANSSAPADSARAWFDFLDGIAIDQKGSEVHLRGRLDAATARAFVAAAGNGQAAPKP